MTIRKKIVLVWMIIKQLLVIGLFALCLFLVVWDPDMSKTDIIISPILDKYISFTTGLMAKISPDNDVIISFGPMIIPIALMILFYIDNIAYSLICKFLQYSYLIAWIIVKFTWWTIFIPPVAIIIWVFCLLGPLALNICLSACLPIVPGLVYILAIDVQPKQEIFNNYSE